MNGQKNVDYTHQKYKSAIKRKKTVFEMTDVSLENTELSEINQIQKEGKPGRISLMCVIKTKKLNP